MLATTHLEDADLVVTALRKHSALTCSAGDERRADLHGLAFADHENLVKGDFCANFCRYLFYFQFFASDNAILLATGFYDRVHVGLQKRKKVKAKNRALYEFSCSRQRVPAFSGTRLLDGRASAPLRFRGFRAKGSVRETGAALQADRV
jgi:hypothetical protein